MPEESINGRLNPSRTAEQDETSHQKAMNQLREEAMRSTIQITNAVTAAVVQKILTPGAGAKSFQETLSDDVAGEQQRIKAAQSTKPETGG